MIKDPCSNVSGATLAAQDLAIRRSAGQAIPEELIQSEFPAIGHALYAKVTNDFRNHFAEDVAATQPTTLGARLQNKLSISYGAVKSWINIIQDAQPVLGEKFSKPLLDALQEHWEQTKGNDRKAFDRDVLPVIEQMRGQLQTHFTDSGKLSFAQDWLDFWANGGRLYNGTVHAPENFKSFDPKAQAKLLEIHDKLEKANRSEHIRKAIGKVIMYPVKTMAENLVVNNPFIASAHTLQVVPKALAMYGPEATIKGMLEHAKRTGEHKLFGEDAELRDRGVYRGHEPGFNLVAAGDNLAKGIAYRIGEAAGKEGLDAVQNIAYSYRLGREPMIMWHAENAAQVYLMRFAIESTKMYGGWLGNIAQGVRRGDIKMAAAGAGSLVAFHLAQAMFTGTKSSVPAFLYPLLNDDTKTMLDEWDREVPLLNVAGHATGLDFKHYQPGGGFAMGVAQDIVNSDIKGGYTHTKKAIESMEDHDFTRAGVEFGRGFFSASQPLVPGVRIAYKKLFDVVGDVLTGDTPLEDAPGEVQEKLGFPRAENE